MRNVASTKIIKRNGEWIVLAFDEEGKHFPEADYFASDKADAVETANRMSGPHGD